MISNEVTMIIELCKLNTSVFIYIFIALNTHCTNNSIILAVHSYQIHTKKNTKFSPLINYLSKKYRKETIVRISLNYKGLLTIACVFTREDEL